VATAAAKVVGAPIAAAAAAVKAVTEAFTGPAEIDELTGKFAPTRAETERAKAQQKKAAKVAFDAFSKRESTRSRNPCERIVNNYLTAEEKSTKRIGSVRKANLAREISSDPNTGVSYGQVTNCLSGFAVYDDRK
jgi:hypothetical protein